MANLGDRLTIDTAGTGIETEAGSLKNKEGQSTVRIGKEMLTKKADFLSPTSVGKNLLLSFGNADSVPFSESSPFTASQSTTDHTSPFGNKATNVAALPSTCRGAQNTPRCVSGPCGQVRSEQDQRRLKMKIIQ